jgi:hypothetical protein
MRIQSIILGALLIVLGIALNIMGAPGIPSMILVFFGGLLIIFSNIEDTIAERNSAKKSKKSNKKVKKR